MSEVSIALASPSDQIRCAAAVVLGNWSTREATWQLKNALMASYKMENQFRFRDVVIKALTNCITADDGNWLLDHFFAVPGVWRKHELLALVLALPPKSVISRLFVESRSPVKENRQAAMKAIGHMDFPARTQLLERFEQDQDPDINQAARELLTSISSKQIRKMMQKP